MISVESTSETEKRHQPGDDLSHVCATHSDMDDGTALCQLNVGCVSYCGIDLTGFEWNDDDPDAPVDADSCVVCEDMWQAKP